MNMNISKCLARLGLALALWVVVAGCSKYGKESQAVAFDRAPPEIKADWDMALAADKTNDYYTASTTYAKILNRESQLTPKQLETLEATSRDLSQRMVAAANEGDDAAKQALTKLMKEQNKR